jgi:tetratricopeptide (TPR) repeat protein
MHYSNISHQQMPDSFFTAAPVPKLGFALGDRSATSSGHNKHKENRCGCLASGRSSMNSKFFRFLLFILVGIVLAGCFAIKPLFGGLALLVTVTLYLLLMQTIYRRMTKQKELPVAVAGQELEPAQVYYRRARQRWEQGNQAGAMSDFELAIAEEVCSAEVYYQYAMLLLETGNAIDGVVRLEQAINQARYNQEEDIQTQATATLSRLRQKFPQLAGL